MILHNRDLGQNIVIIFLFCLVLKIHNNLEAKIKLFKDEREKFLKHFRSLNAIQKMRDLNKIENTCIINLC